MLGHFQLSELLSLPFVICKYCVIQTQTLNIIQTTMGKWNQIAFKMLHGKKHNFLFCCPSCWPTQLCILIFCFYLIIMIKADLFTHMVKLLLINVEFQWNYHSFHFLKCQNSFPNKPPQKSAFMNQIRNEINWLGTYVYAFEIDIICSMSPLVEQINFELSWQRQMFTFSIAIVKK